MSIPAIDMKATGENIKNLRMLFGMSVKDLQEIFGFGTPQAIYKWQRGKALPTLDNLVVFATVFSVSMDEIIVTTSEKTLHIGA